MGQRPITVLTAAAALVACVGAAPAPAAVAPAGQVSATLETCHPASDLTGRYATFAAQMSAVPGTEQMSIRLGLDERTPVDQDFRALVGVPGFGVWKTSTAGVDIFSYSQEVTSLTAPAAFRVTVGYRWIGAHHRVIKRTHRTTAVCRLPGAGPPSGLVVGSVARLP